MRTSLAILVVLLLLGILSTSQAEASERPCCPTLSYYIPHLSTRIFEADDGDTCVWFDFYNYPGIYFCLWGMLCEDGHFRWDAAYYDSEGTYTGTYRRGKLSRPQYE